MALVSPQVPFHLRHPQQMHGHSRSSSSSSVRSTTNLLDIGEEVVAERVYVSVGKEYKESKETLIWALQNLSKDMNKKVVVLVHVHRPAQTIPLMGANFPVKQLTEEQVRGYRQLERQKMNKTLDEYVSLCSCAKIQAEKLVIEADDIAKGLVEIITSHGIKKLIMGAAAEKQYSKKMKAPKSKTAINVQQHADQSCKIWFICKGNLICSRETVLDGSAIARSPIANLQSIEQPQTRSKSLPKIQTPTTDRLAQRSRSVNNIPCSGQVTALSPHEMPTAAPRPASISSADVSPWESRSSQASDYSTSPGIDEVVNSFNSLPMPKDEENKKVPSRYLQCMGISRNYNFHLKP